MRNERRTLGSVRGYGRPAVERPHGARSLLYSMYWVLFRHSRRLASASFFLAFLNRNNFKKTPIVGDESGRFIHGEPNSHIGGGRVKGRRDDAYPVLVIPVRA